MNLDSGETPVANVPIGYWQAAELPEKEAFAFGTNVCAPPFSFDEFCIADRESLLTDYPNAKELILRLTRVSIKVISEKRPNETRNCQNNNGIK